MALTCLATDWWALIKLAVKLEPVWLGFARMVIKACHFIVRASERLSFSEKDREATLARRCVVAAITLVVGCVVVAAEFTLVTANAFKFVVYAIVLLVWMSALLLVLSPVIIAYGGVYDLVRRAYTVAPVRRAALFFARPHHHVHHQLRLRTRRRPRNLGAARKYDYDAMQRHKGRVSKLEALQERSKLAQVVGALKEACAPTTTRTLWKTASSGRKVGVVVSLVVLLLVMIPIFVGMQPLPTQQLLPAVNQVQRRVRYVVRPTCVLITP